MRSARPIARARPVETISRESHEDRIPLSRAVVRRSVARLALKDREEPHEQALVRDGIQVV